MLRRLVLMLILLIPEMGWSDIVVVVNPANRVRSLTAQEVASLYLGRNRNFPSGEYALVFDMPRDSTVRERFFRQVAGMTLGQVNTYWSRLMFSGQETPPQPLPNEQAVLDIVRRNPSAIGYLDALPTTNNLRVVLHLKE
jgi:ABC-type phosphate transport system substrate-binding protein